MAGQLSFDFSDSGIVEGPERAAGDCWTAPQAGQLAGITYRQLDYWARTQLVVPSIQCGIGSGRRRMYSFADIVLLRTVRQLLETGISLQKIRVAVDALRERHDNAGLAAITMISDGTTIHQVESPEEIVDLLRGGQGVFALCMGTVVKAAAADVVKLPGIAIGELDSPVAEDTNDELGQRRQLRAAS